MFTRRKSQKPAKKGFVIKKESTTEQPLIMLETLTSDQFLQTFRNHLPDVLSSRFKVEKPEKTILIDYPDIQGLAWQEQKVSELYMEILNPADTLKKKWFTSKDFESLQKNCGWEKKRPLDTISIKLRSKGDPELMMQAKKLVLYVLDGYQTTLELLKKPILQEAQTDDIKNGEFVITFSVKGRPDIVPIMSFVDSIDKYSESISDKAQLTLKTVMSDYQEKLRACVVDGFRVEEVAATPDRKGKQPRPNVADARKMLAAINTAAETLQRSLGAMINNTKEFELTKPGVKALTALLQQVEDALKDDFKNELDTQRWKRWLTVKPGEKKILTEDDLVPGTGGKQGAGAQGSVFKYELDPQMGRDPVVLKYDRNGLNGDAITAGIPELNPQQSVRAVAAFKISEELELGIIPQTEFFVGTDENGRPKLGQAMAVVKGPVGQDTAALRDAPADQALAQDLDGQQAIIDNPGNHTQMELKIANNKLGKYVKVDDVWYLAKKDVPADVDYNHRVIQKGLSDLQVFDCIIGHADRNPGNWIYEKQGNTIIRVKGIDNDDTFGEAWSKTNPNANFPSEKGSKTPGIPPIVDISTALSILTKNFDTEIQPLLEGLSQDEKNAAKVRFGQVQQDIAQSVKDGNIASMGDDAAGDLGKLNLLRQKVPGMPAQLQLKTWGNLGIPDPHTKDNSYLGFQKAQINVEGVVGDDGFFRPPAQPPVQAPGQPVAQPPAQLVAQQQVQLPAQQQAQLPAQQQLQLPDQFPPLPVVPNQ